MDVKKLSGFMAGVCASAGAMASTCTPGSYDPADGSSCVLAPPGRYVPLAGASAATLAPPGTFVNVTGATAAVQAPAGYYVPSSGATAAIAAPVGYYVATQGASAPTPVGVGFYTATAGSTAPIGAGMLAGTMNLAVSGARDILATQQSLGESGKAGFDLSVTVGGTRLEQAGLGASSNQNIRANSLVLQHRSGTTATDWRVFGGLADQSLKGITAGSGDGRTWLLGIGRGLAWGKGEPVTATAFIGQASSDIVRRVTELSTPETQQHSGTVRILGLQLAASTPVSALAGNLRLEGGLSHFTQSAVTETPTAAGTTAGLTVAKTSLWSLPTFVGVEHVFNGMTLQWGMRADLNPRRSLTASLASGGSYQFAVPIQATSAPAGVVRVRFKSMDLGSGLTLDGGAQLTAGPKMRQQQVQLTLAKRW